MDIAFELSHDCLEDLQTCGHTKFHDDGTYTTCMQPATRWYYRVDRGYVDVRGRCKKHREVPLLKGSTWQRTDDRAELERLAEIVEVHGS